MSRKPRPPRISAALEEALRGLDWHWEPGKRHWLIKVGDAMVAVRSYGRKGAEYRENWTIEKVRHWRKTEGL